MIPPAARSLAILLVDDSVVARRVIADALAPCTEVGCLVTAASGAIALRKCARWTPDVAIVDLDMPEMDGIALLAALRRLSPRTRVLIHTADGALSRTRAAEALLGGASEVLLKPVLPAGPYEGQLTALREALLPKLRQFAPRASGGPLPVAFGHRTEPRIEAVAIAVSTGGPEALARLLPALPQAFGAPVMVVQHMPPGFTAPLAARLARLGRRPVAEAADGEPIAAGRVYLAPAGRHLVVEPGAAGARLRLTDDPPENSCRPSADLLLRSAAATYGQRLAAVVLTGMGADGLDGARACRAAGARVVAQDQATSVVWGMPGAVVEAGLADAVLPLDEIARWLAAASR